MIKNLPKNRFAAIVALFISLLMPTMAKAQEAYAVEDGATLTFYYDNQRANRTGTVYGIDQKQESNNDVPAWAGAGAGQYNDRITKAVFDTSFQKYLPSSTSYWLYNCRKIAAIEGIENLNTKNVTDMSYMFYNCQSLTSLDLSNFDTRNVTDMNTMFNGCYVLISLNLSNFDTEKVTDMNSMFYNCKVLTSLDVSSFNTQNVTDMHWMFLGCRALTELDVSNFNTGNVTRMNSMFYNCKALTSLDVSSFNTQNVTDMQWMFLDCSALTKLDVSNFNTEKVTNMNSMFSGCSALTKLDVSNFKTEKVTDMSEMFYGCSALTTIYCNDTWTCDESTKMFYSCSSLVGAVPFNSSNIDVSMANPYTGYFTANTVYEAYAVEDGTTLTFYYDGKRDMRSGTTYTTFDEHQWTGSDITKVVFDATFNHYLPTSTASWFQDCSKLGTIEGLDNLNTENVTDMSNMFNGCSVLYSLNVSNFNTERVTDMSNMFRNCYALTELDVTGFNTENVTDMSYMFYGCNALTELDLSNLNTEKVTNMSNMFEGCSALTTIYCNETWTCDNSTDMFKGCTSLIGAVAYDASKTDVTMANPDIAYFTCKPYVVEDGTTLTFYCDNQRANRTGTVYTTLDEHQWAGEDITKVAFDTSFRRYSPTSTASWFQNYTSLEKIVGIENLCTENVTDMNKMFNGCSALVWLDLSNFNTENVTDMSNMFNGCSALTTIYCNDTWTCDVSTDMFNGCTSIIGAVAYDASRTDVTMANPETGYFTRAEAYIVEDDATLTFYYDDQRANRTGTAYDIDQTHSGTTNPIWASSGWGKYNDNITKVVFDASFKDYRPRTTENWFYNCRKIAAIEGIENLNTENVTHMGGMFWGCESLTSLDVTGFNTEKVTNMLGTFYGCSSLTELDVTGFVTDNVTNMDGLFNRCKRLTTIDVSGFNTENVTDMHNMFLYCFALEWLDLSNFNTEKVTDMHEMFLNCNALKTIYCNDTWKCDVSTNMFYGCTSLKGAVSYSSSNKTDVSMANPETGYFTTCSVEKEAYAVEDGTTLTFYYDKFRASRTGTVYDIDQTHSGTTIPVWAGTGWSVYNDKITKVVFDASFKKFHPSTTENWFYNCRKIAAIEGIENLNTEKVTDMSYMFDGCSALTDLDLSNLNTENVTNMRYMFNSCFVLTSIDLSNLNTENVTNMEGMFGYCSSLSSLDVTGFNTENVTDMSYMFKGCSALTSLDVTGFNTKNVTYMTILS